ncbi:MAG: class IV adenylate cyclase [Clostridiales bacterium]|nr:class IV adenylate cyclase [Clostridiales bacterium]
MIEVEIKLPVHRRSTIEHGLTELGFAAGHLIRESDTYFTSAFHDFMQTDEALRIRESEDYTTASATASLTYKGPKLDTVSTTRKELETVIENATVCRDILRSLGYKELAPVRKLRQYYHLDDVTACVDQVEELGSFLELEIIVDSEILRKEALHRIENILESLGCSMSETTRYSYLYMLRQRHAAD